MEKQEKVLKKLEQQHQEQKKILEEQKKILQELKQHKESHEEMKRNEMNKKNEVISSPVLPKEDNVVVKPAKNAVYPEKKPDIQNPAPEKVLDKKIESKSPTSSKNTSLDSIVKQVSKDIQNSHLNVERKENLNVKDRVTSNKLDNDPKKLNNSAFDVKQEILNVDKNLTGNFMSKSNPSNLDISPSITKDYVVSSSPRNLKNDEIHLKLRETLEKKPDFEMTLSLPKDGVNLNDGGYNKDRT